MSLKECLPPYAKEEFPANTDVGPPSAEVPRPRQGREGKGTQRCRKQTAQQRRRRRRRNRRQKIEDGLARCVVELLQVGGACGGRADGRGWGAPERGGGREVDDVDAGA